MFLFVDPTTGFDGLADILENGLYELNTVADDGSLEEVCIFFSHFSFGGADSVFFRDATER